MARCARWSRSTTPSSASISGASAGGARWRRCQSPRGRRSLPCRKRDTGMENKAHALAAGTFVLLVTALLIALAAWLMRDKEVFRVYEMSTREALSGLQLQAP